MLLCDFHAKVNKNLDHSTLKYSWKFIQGLQTTTGFIFFYNFFFLFYLFPRAKNQSFEEFKIRFKWSAPVELQELQDDRLSLFVLYIRRDNLNNNSSPNVCERNLISNQSGGSAVTEASKGFSLSVCQLCQDCTCLSYAMFFM